MKKIYSGLLLLAACFILIGPFLSGCISKSNEKTVINTEGKAQDKMEMKFKVKKISKVKQQGMARGWINNENILLFASKVPEDIISGFQNEGVYKWLEMRRSYYNTDKYIKVVENKKFMDGKVSPDKNKIAYTQSLDANNKQVIIKDLKKEKDFIVTQLNRKSNINWSNNSRYLTVIKMNIIVIWDSHTAKTREFSINGLDIDPVLTQAKISDDGKKLLFSNSDVLYLFDVSGDEINLKKETIEKYKIGTSSYAFSFYSSKNILYVSICDEITALYTYDMDTGNKNLIMKGVHNFALSPDKKYIAFYKNIDSTMYLGNLMETDITKDIIAFKGKVSGDMWWSNDNKKILFYGEVDGNFDNYVLEVI